jgi:hypothetical protein
MCLIHFIFFTKIHFFLRIKQWWAGKKSMCLAAEGMVVGWGCQTLAFVRWLFPYFFCLFAAKISYYSVVCFVFLQ